VFFFSRKVITSLLSFGFQSTHGKIRDMARGLVRLLDGRTDVEEVEIGDEDESEVGDRTACLRSPPTLAHRVGARGEWLIGVVPFGPC